MVIKINNRQRAKDLKIKYQSVPADGSMLYPNSCIVENISCKIGSTDLGTIALFDGSTKVLTIDMKNLTKTIGDMRIVDTVKGVAWARPHLKDSLEVNISIMNHLRAEGNVDDLFLWIDQKPNRPLNIV